MTEQELIALQEQVNKNTQAIEELKEAFQTIGTAAPAVASNETLLKALQEQIDKLTDAQTQMCAELDRVADRTTILEENVTTNTNDIALLKEKPSGPQMELVGTTLNITMPVAEGTTTTEETATTEEAAAAEETTEST